MGRGTANAVVLLGRLRVGTTAQSPSSHEAQAPVGKTVTAHTDADLAEEFAKASFSISELARACDRSVRQFERKFKERFGACPRDLLQKIRMAVARERLFSDASLKQIAAELRYNDAANFTRAFRHYYHVSPSQMRRKLLKKYWRIGLDVAF